MLDAITDVHGISVGHAQNGTALTGCTVVLAGEGAVVGADVRGLAPGTRETDLCRPGTLVERAQAVLLTGGSAFGLDAATGVTRYLYERGLGFKTGSVAVPIVPGAVIFDLGIGEAAWPDAEMGYQACVAAGTGALAQGNVGVGTGATVGKFLGSEQAMKSGVGTASRAMGAVTVGALIAVNPLGNVVDPESGRPIAGARSAATGEIVSAASALLSGRTATNSTIGLVAIDANLSSVDVQRMAAAAHDGMALAVRPVHTLYDGDVMFALATGGRGPVDIHPLALHVAVVDVVTRAIVSAVTHASGAGGLPGAGDLPIHQVRDS